MRGRIAAPSAPQPAFRCGIDAAMDGVVLTPCGDLDIDTVPILDGDLHAVRALGFETVVLDLRELTFIDSAGVHLLVEWAVAAARRGHAFRLIPGSDRVRLVFKLTGVLGALGLNRHGAWRRPPAPRRACPV